MIRQERLRGELQWALGTLMIGELTIEMQNPGIKARGEDQEAVRTHTESRLTEPEEN